MPRAFQCEEFLLDRFDHIGSFEQPAGSDPAHCDVSHLTRSTAQDVLPSGIVKEDNHTVGFDSPASCERMYVAHQCAEFSYERHDQVGSLAQPAGNLLAATCDVRALTQSTAQDANVLPELAFEQLAGREAEPVFQPVGREAEPVVQPAGSDT